MTWSLGSEDWSPRDDKMSNERKGKGLFGGHKEARSDRLLQTSRKGRGRGVRSLGK